jgi:hypothetical protein
MSVKCLKMVIIPGNMVRGLGKATQALQLQMPEFVEVCPELSKCRIGTINVILECQLEVISPDFVIGPIDWCGDGVGESFGLLGVCFEVIEPRSETDAWIYIPYGSPHRLNPYYVEILAPPLSLGCSSACKVHLTAGKVTATRVA